MKKMMPVVHFEIPVGDQKRAAKFYTSVFNWKMQGMPMDDHGYTLAITTPMKEDQTHEEKGAINGGMFKRSEELQHPIITINVPSIDDFSNKIETAGGRIVVQKGEVPDMGYYAYFKDPEGNIIGLWENM